MFQLFSLRPTQTLADTLSQLHDSDLTKIFGRTILNRAYDYLDAIDSLEVKPGVVEAEVHGTELYEVTLKHRSGDIYGDCSCPYEAACKHLAALLMHLRDEVETKELAVINLPAKHVSISKNKSAAFDFDRYLEDLDADELRALVRQFAPESYRRTLAAQHAAPEVMQKARQSADKKVRDLLKKVEHYGPSEFETELVKRLNVMRPYWLSDTVAVTKLLYDTIVVINEAQGEGYLYDDYNDHIFDGDEVGLYLAAFVAVQPVERLLITLQSLAEALEEGEFDICSNFFSEVMSLLSDTKRRAVLPIFLRTDALVLLPERQQRLVWQHLQPLLMVAEQQQVLAKLINNQFFLLELVAMCEREGEVDRAVQLLEHALPVQEHRQSAFAYLHHAGTLDKTKLFERRIELEKQHRQSRELRHWVIRYIKETATAQSLYFALSYLPQEQKVLEALLQKANMNAFARYLEDQKRLDEVVMLFNLTQGAPPFDTQYEFFKRHKKDYPEASKAIFVQVLTRELPHTGEQHYRAVTEALTQLKVIEPAADFQKRVADIRLQYKRRINLMDKLKAAKL